MKLSFPSRNWRRAAVATPAVAASLAIALGAASGPASAKTTTAKNKSITLTVGYIGTTNTFTGPEGFAYSKGLLQKWLAKDKVKIKSTAAFANGPLLTAALLGGSVDLGEVGDTPALIGKSQGAPTRIINQDQLNLESVLITQTSIKSLSDLAGKEVYRQQASYMDRWIQAYLQSKGLLKKVDLIGALFSSSIPAFNSGSVPALVLPPQDLTEVTTKYNTLASSTTTPAWTGTSVTEVTNQALAQDPGLPAAWNAARDEALAYANAHLSAYYKWSAKVGSTTVAQEKKYESLANDPTQPFTKAGITHLEGTLKFLVASGEAKSFSIAKWEAPAA